MFCLHMRGKKVISVYEPEGAEWIDMGDDDRREMLQGAVLKVRCLKCKRVLLEKPFAIFRDKITKEGCN